MFSVPQGRYRLRFQLGSGWLSESRRFCEIYRTSDFERAFDFEETRSEKEIQYNAHEVTLHPVPEGTAKTHAIADSLFKLPSPMSDNLDELGAHRNREGQP